jgi:hypothetical protein
MFTLADLHEPVSGATNLHGVDTTACDRCGTGDLDVFDWQATAAQNRCE